MQRTTFAFVNSARRIAARQIAIGAPGGLSPSIPLSSPLLLRGGQGTLPKNWTMILTVPCQSRGYAKKGGKGGKGGKNGSSGDDEDEEDSSSRKRKGKNAGSPSVDLTFDSLELETKMGQCLERLKKEFTTMRTGTANPAILDPVMVKVEKRMVPLRDLAQVSIKDAKTLMVNVNDPELVAAIEKAIREAGLNLNPIADNKAVKVPVPKPTKESREALVKQASVNAEKSKAIIRKLRQDGMKDLKKDLKSGISSDEHYSLEKKAQTLHDKYIKEIEDALKAKTKEIMSN
ncbi:MAG: ribosome recycling factor domain-containing protein [Benniella sp.]|nr:MAG: ribosome recycling factor domain-containing protein [Benniella sp.]